MVSSCLWYRLRSKRHSGHNMLLTKPNRNVSRRLYKQKEKLLLPNLCPLSSH